MHSLIVEILQHARSILMYFSFGLIIHVTIFLQTIIQLYVSPTWGSLGTHN